MDIILPELVACPTLVKVDLECNKLDHEGFVAVAELLNCQPALSVLSLPKNEIDNVKSAKVLADAVSAHPNLDCLRLMCCDIGKRADVLSSILSGCEGLVALDLRSNHIDSKSIPAVTKFVSDNHQKVKTLDFEGNDFKDSDVPALVTSLKSNTNLRIFDITENEQMTGDGREEMMKAVLDTTSLNDVVASNHHVKLMLTTQDNSPGFSLFGLSMFFGGLFNNRVRYEDDMQHVNCMEFEEIEDKIKYKVSYALRESAADDIINLQYLNDDLPVGVMPRVLELVQREMCIAGPNRTHLDAYHPFPCLKDRFSEDSERHALSRVFAVVKGWEMPVLFEYGGSSSARPRAEKCRMQEKYKEAEKALAIPLMCL